MSGFVEGVEQGGEVVRDGAVADGVVAAVRAEAGVHAAVVVADGADVQLHDPAAPRVFAAEVDEQGGLELCGFLFAGGFAAEAVGEDGIEGFFVRYGGVAQDFQAVVGGEAAVSREVFQAFVESGGEVVVAADGDAACCFEAFDVGGVVGVFDFDGFVRAPAGADFDGKGFVGGDGGVVFEAVAGVVSGADHFDVHLFEDAARAEGGFFEAGVRFLPDGFGACAVQQGGDAEGAFEFEVCPVIERVADEVRHGFGVGLEFFARAGVAGDEVFGDAEGAQAAPFVVVAFEPDGGKIGELAVRGDVSRRQVAVVVVDGLVFGVVVVEGARGVVVEEEVVGQEGHGWLRLVCVLGCPVKRWGCRVLSLRGFLVPLPQGEGFWRAEARPTFYVCCTARLPLMMRRRFSPGGRVTRMLSR